jgi:hypothetical protein
MAYPDHDDKTSYEIFHAVVTILSSLIRLRRDLVASILPHLGHLLRQLIFALRQARPQLGAKQSRLVTDTLPLWINAAQPLGANEAQALARLLIALTTKTVVRTFASGPSAPEQTAVSLARPFARHAAPVLRAYLDAMNDTLCVLPMDVRRELEPGLFALCEMMSEHDRDALVASALDTGGKAVLQALWQAYERQRYVGKG